jgi:hypothetical protein
MQHVQQGAVDGSLPAFLKGQRTECVTVYSTFDDLPLAFATIRFDEI